MTTAGSYDFNGYQVLVVGGTRGEGHRIASAFSASGASVTVTDAPEAANADAMLWPSPRVPPTTSTW